MIETAKALPCPCGSMLPPTRRRRGSKSLLLYLQCPSCRFRSAGDVPENLIASWNAAVRAVTTDKVPKW
jgi:hypothetical protein